jgi:alcohol dehydrogenase (NADP+)
MEYLEFNNGDLLPKIGLGTWLSKKNEVFDAVLAAIKIGYRHFDCAYIYGNETEIGRALNHAISIGLVKRTDLFITSKLWNSDHLPERVEIAIRKTILDLQLDYLDLYLIHWPIAFKTNHEQAKDATDLLSLEEMPLTTTWLAMESVKKLGLTKHIGVSNFNIPKLELLINNSNIRPEVNQVELHPYFQQKGLLNYCKSQGIILTAYSPLGSRHLINTDAGITREEIIINIAAKHSCTPAQVLLSWGMQRDVAVIPKSINPVRILENFESLNVILDNIDIERIENLERNLRIAKGLYCIFPDGYYTLNNIWEE